MTEKKDVEMENLTDLAVVRFAAARAREIASLNAEIENPKNNKLIFQKLPCHMRRRAMSHNPNRMPRVLREAHKAQMEKSGNIVKPKRPRRKYRERPSRLSEEYSRRSGNTLWLETHIWHAKRFHITTKWGCKLPAQSCDRKFKFCYRSAANNCLLMDVSYLCCIEINGPQSKILDGLKSLSNSNSGSTFGAASVLIGNFEGRCMMYRKDQYPCSPIGLVTFTWRYGDTNVESRALWIWIHPAFFHEIQSELQSVFQLDSEMTNLETGIKLIRNRLNRFRLRGPLSYQVLAALLDPTTRSTVAQLAPGFIMGTTIRDPRITMPQERCQPSTEFDSDSDSDSPSAPNKDKEVSRSCMWDADERDRISKLRELIPDEVIKERRQKLLVPGTELPREPDEQPVPLLVINASHEGERYVPGCDLVIPAEWATAFWSTLIYNGAHAGGLSDAERMPFEFGVGRDLLLEIDTEAGKAESATRKSELMEAYFRKPPKNRSNYIKLATPYPFGVDWNRLVTDWMDTDITKSFYVLRDWRVLRSISPGSAIPEAIQNEPCLVFVSLRVTGRGLPQEFAMICLPHEQDNPNGSEPIVEPAHKDPAAKERKSLRQEHQSELRRLARKRKAEEDNAKEEHSSLPINAAYKEKMRSLWLPVPCNLKTSFHRSVIGFVCQGDFGLSKGRGMANGYIVANALPLLMKKVLIRNAAQNMYMWAEIKVVN